MKKERRNVSPPQLDNTCDLHSTGVEMALGRRYAFCHRMFTQLLPSVCVQCVQIAIHHHGSEGDWHDNSDLYNMHLELMELLGINRERIVPVRDEV